MMDLPQGITIIAYSYRRLMGTTFFKGCKCAVFELGNVSVIFLNSFD